MDHHQWHLSLMFDLPFWLSFLQLLHPLNYSLHQLLRCLHHRRWILNSLPNFPTSVQTLPSDIYGLQNYYKQFHYCKQSSSYEFTLRLTNKSNKLGVNVLCYVKHFVIIMIWIKCEWTALINENNFDHYFTWDLFVSLQL